MSECIENQPIKYPFFREDFLGQYMYDPETNEVVFLKTEEYRVEASVLIEMLADFIIDISQVQSSGGKANEL